jgi:hypothetical protein
MGGGANVLSPGATNPGAATEGVIQRIRDMNRTLVFSGR